jgi:hypothetical protein
MNNPPAGPKFGAQFPVARKDLQKRAIWGKQRSPHLFLFSPVTPDVRPASPAGFFMSGLSNLPQKVVAKAPQGVIRANRPLNIGDADTTLLTCNPLCEKS